MTHLCDPICVPGEQVPESRWVLLREDGSAKELCRCVCHQDAPTLFESKEPA